MTTYVDMVHKLVKPGDQILSELTAEDVHLIHMTMGIVGEISELLAATTKEEFIEEAGDVEFYLEGFRSGLNLTREQVLEYLPQVEGQLAANDMIIFSGSLIDTIKKCAFYQIPADKIKEKILIALCGIESCLDFMRTGLDITRCDIITGNIEKLGKRYPGFEYTDDRAKQRADKTH